MSANDTDTELPAQDIASQTKPQYPFSMYDSDNEISSNPSPKKNTNIPKKPKPPKSKVYIPSISDSEDDDEPLSNQKMDIIDLTDDNVRYIFYIFFRLIITILITGNCLQIEDNVPLSTYVEPSQDSCSSASVNTQPSKYEPTHSWIPPQNSSSASSSSSAPSYVLLPGQFDIILLVDTAETT